MTPDEFIQLQRKIGCSNVQLADWLGVSPVSVSRWRKGARTPGPPVERAMNALADGWRPE